MSKQLYEEALADVKKLKEVAEDNAKRALLEAVTPRIKDLIENQLLGEMEDDKDKKEDPDALLLDEPGETPSEETGASTDEGEPSEPGVEESSVYELSVESARALGLLVKESTGFDEKLRSVSQRLKGLANASRIVKESVGFGDAISSLLEEVEDMYAYVQEKVVSPKKKASYESILENHYSTLKQLTERKMKRNRLSEVTLELEFPNLDASTLPEDALESPTITFGGGEDEEEGEESLDDDLLSGEEEEDEEEEEEGADDEEGEEEEEGKMESRKLSDNMVVEIDEGMLRREISRMKALREAKDDVQAWGHGPGDVSDEFADEEMDVLSVKLTTEGEMDEDDVLEIVDDEKDEKGGDEKKKGVDQGMYEYGDMKEEELDEMDPMEEMEKDDLDELEQAEDERSSGGNVAAEETGPGAATKKQSRQPGATVESLRRHLAREGKIQLEAKKKAQAAKAQGKKAQIEQQQAKKKGQQKDAAAKGKKAKQMAEAYVHYAKQFNESVLRTQKLKGMLNEAVRKGSALNGAPTRSAEETNVLRDRLAETNLFNTKLLFANKVLQNESFTRTQKAGIIERLDEARSEREVKLVYESLVKTLDNTTRRQVNESRERAVLGSSSRPTRPASTLNEGFETDRWARLAGIVK